MIDKAFCDKVATISLGNLDTKYNTWDLCERAINEKIPGDFAEAGVYAGCHPIIMAKVANIYRQHNRKIHLYDSFEGVPKVREERDHVEIKTYQKSEDGKIESSGVAAVSLDYVKKQFIAKGVPLTNVVFHKGWFQNVLPFETIPTFAVLRVDVDLMESNELCFRYLYSKLSSGGYFCTDDWGGSNGPAWQKMFHDLIDDMKLEQPKEITPVEGQPSTAWWKKP